MVQMIVRHLQPSAVFSFVIHSFPQHSWRIASDRATVSYVSRTISFLGLGLSTRDSGRTLVIFVILFTEFPKVRLLFAIKSHGTSANSLDTHELTGAFRSKTKTGRVWRSGT